MEKHYIEKVAVAPDLTKALEKFATVRPPAVPLSITEPLPPYSGPGL